MNQGLKGLQQYLNFMHIFSYGVNGKRMVCKSKNNARLERALKKVNTLFLTGPKNPMSSLVTITRSVNHRSGGRRCSSVEIIFRIIDEPQKR